MPSLTALLGLGFPHPIVTELSPEHAVSGLPSSATGRAHPKPHPRLDLSARSLHLFVDRRTLEPLLARPDSGAARRCGRSYRRPCHHRCRRGRRACPKKPRRRGSPVAAGGAIPSVLRSVGRLEGARSSLPAASLCPPPARTGAGSELLAARRSAGMLRASRMGGDSFPRLDSRGGNYLPGVTGPGGGDSPAGMTRWAGIPPSKPLSREDGSPRDTAVLVRRLPGDPGRN